MKQRGSTRGQKNNGREEGIKREVKECQYICLHFDDVDFSGCCVGVGDDFS